MILKELLFKIKVRRSDPQKRAILYKKHCGVCIGDNCKFFGKVDFGSEPYLITMGNHVMLSDGVRFANHDGGIQVLDVNGMLPGSDIFGMITIEDNVFIGQNALILKNVHIGSNVIIGANAVITKDCESNAVYAGVPAKKIRSLDEYYTHVKSRADFTLNYTAEEKKRYLMEKYNLYQGGGTPR